MRHHNAPPISERLSLEYSDMSEEISAALTGLDTPHVHSDEDAAAIGTIGKQLVAIAAKAEKARKTEKDEYLQAGKQVDAFFGNMVADLNFFVLAARAAVGAYQTKKRQAALDAERIEREAAKVFGGDAPEQVAPKETVRIVAPSGAPAVSGTVKWAYEVTDFDAVPRELLMLNEDAVAAKIAGLKASMKDIGKAAIPGLRLFEKVQARFG